MVMTITMLKQALQHHSIQVKFMVLQVVLVLAKVQGLVTRLVTWSGMFPCKPPLTPPVYGNCKLNIHTMIENFMIPISFYSDLQLCNVNRNVTPYHSR